MKDLDYKSRVLWMDVLRVFVALCVVTIHVAYINRGYAGISFLDSKLSYLLNSLVIIADPIFFMISGSMMLSSKKNYSYKFIINNKIRKFVIAFCFWSFIYAFIDMVVIRFFHGGISEGLIKNFLTEFIKGYNQLWFLYSLSFLYLCIPFLKKICEDKKAETIFITLSLLPLILSFVNNFHEFEFIVGIKNNTCFEIVTGYTVFFVLGHYLYKYEIAKKVRMICYIITLLLITISFIFDKSYEYLSLQNYFTSVSVFLIFKYGVSKLKVKEKIVKFIVKLSSLTFGVFLIHNLFVIVLTYIDPNLNVPGTVNLFIILESVIVYILSFFVVWIISKIPLLKKYII